MKLIFTNSDIVSDSGFYYSPEFLINSGDNLMTIECTLASNGDVIMQSSIDKINWYDVSNSTFTCSPSGLQSYTDCQIELLYRAKSSISFILIKILI